MLSFILVLLNFVLQNEEELGIDDLRNLLMEAISLFRSEMSVLAVDLQTKYQLLQKDERDTT